MCVAGVCTYECSALGGHTGLGSSAHLEGGDQAGEAARRLRVLGALAEDQSVVLSTMSDRSLPL